MANNKYCGNVSDYAPVSEDQSRVVIMYGLKEDGDKAEWYQIDFYKKQGKPTFEAAKKAIEEDINARVDDAILCGYPWTILHGDDAGKAVKVWLSKENQSNFKAKYDLHFTKPEALTFPTLYKVAEDENGDAVFEEFQSFEELEQFYLGGLGYIEQCYQAGWAEKKSIDWTPYAEALQPVTEKTEESGTKKTTRKK